MAELIVDEEKLVYGLEQGMQNTDVWIPAQDKHDPTKYHLRQGFCGLVSTAILSYAIQREGFDAEVRMAHPRVPFDRDMRHVVTVLTGPDGGEVFVDATYSQFLGYVGLTPWYEMIAREDYFPDRKIVTFSEADPTKVVEELTAVAVNFQANNRYPGDSHKEALGSGPLVAAKEPEVRAAYRQIYDPKRYQSYRPSDRVLADGLEVSQSIPAGSLAWV